MKRAGLISGRRLRGVRPAPFCPRLTAPIGNFFHQKSGGYWATYSRPRPPTRSGLPMRWRRQIGECRLCERQSFFAQSERYRSEMGHAHPTSKVLLPRLRKERHWHLENTGNLLESTRPHSVHAVFVGIPAPYLFRNISRSKEFGERLYLAEEKIKCALIWRLLQPPR